MLYIDILYIYIYNIYMENKEMIASLELLPWPPFGLKFVLSSSCVKEQQITNIFRLAERQKLPTASLQSIHTPLE